MQRRSRWCSRSAARPPGSAGALAGVYFGTIDPAGAGSLLIFAFIVVVIGGMGSVTGSAFAAVVVGAAAAVRQLLRRAGLGDFCVVLLLAVVLLVRPGGFSGASE